MRFTSLSHFFQVLGVSLKITANMIYLMLFMNIVGEPFFFVTYPNSKDLKELATERIIHAGYTPKCMV
jgi:hypothetical protein